MFGKILNTFGTRIVVAFVNLAIAVIISQFLGDSGKGLQSLVLTNISFILIFSEIVCGASLVYLASRYSFSKLWLPSVIWSGVVAVVMGLLMLVPQFGLDRSLALHAATLSFISSFASIHFRLLVGHEEVKKANLNSLLQPLVLVATLLVYHLWLGRRDIYGYIIGLYLAYLASSVLGVIQLRNQYRSFAFFPLREYAGVLKALFKYGFLNQTSHFVQFFNLRLSYYLLNVFVDSGQVGVYSNAVSLAESLWIIFNSIALVQYARVSNSTDTAYNQRLTLDLAKISLAMALPAVLVLAVLPTPFYCFVFGADFCMMPVLIRILAPGTLLYGVYLILGHYYSGSGRYFMNTLSALCGLVVTLACGFTLIPRFSAIGAAVTASLAYSMNAFFLTVCFLRESRFKIRDFVLTFAELKSYILEIKNHYLKQNPS